MSDSRCLSRQLDPVHLSFLHLFFLLPLFFLFFTLIFSLLYYIGIIVILLLLSSVVLNKSVIDMFGSNSSFSHRGNVRISTTIGDEDGIGHAAWCSCRMLPPCRWEAVRLGARAADPIQRWGWWTTRWEIDFYNRWSSLLKSNSAVYCICIIYTCKCICIRICIGYVCIPYIRRLLIMIREVHANSWLVGSLSQCLCL